MKQIVEEAARENILFNHRTVDRTLYGKDLARFGEINFVQGAEWQSKQIPWINVKERFPKMFENVLVLFEYEGKPMVQTDTYIVGINGDWEWKFGESKILAWMYIPSFDDILESNRDVLGRIKEKGD